MSTLEEMAARAQKRSASTQMAFEGAEAEVFNIPLGGSSRDVRPRTTVMDEEEQPQWRAEWLWQVAGVQRQWQKLWWLAPHGALATRKWSIWEPWRIGKSECRVVDCPRQSAAKRSRSIGWIFSYQAVQATQKVVWHFRGSPRHVQIVDMCASKPCISVVCEKKSVIITLPTC